MRVVILATPVWGEKRFSEQTRSLPIHSANSNSFTNQIFTQRFGKIALIRYAMVRKYAKRSYIHVHVHAICDAMKQAPPTCIKEPHITEGRRRGRPLGPCMTCKSGGERVWMQKNVIYHLPCKWCREHYVGETERSLETRLTEHNGEARRHTRDKPWGEHLRTKHAQKRLALGD